MPPRPRTNKATTKAVKKVAKKAVKKAVPAKKTATKAATVGTVKPVTFTQGTAQLIELQVPLPGAPQPDVEFRIVRPDDLVVLAVRCYAMDLVKDDLGPALVPEGDDAFMIVSYTFQHVGEQAFLEQGFPPHVVEARHTPVEVLVAEPSRLAYDVPADERIPFSTDGVLAALSRLQLRVVPLATPRPAATRVIKFPLVTLEDGTVLQYSGNGISLVKNRGRQTAPQTVDELITHSASLRAARTLLAYAGAIDTVAHSSLGDVTRGPITINPGPRRATRAPRFDETAIEAPWRLMISPSTLGGFTHATKPVHAPQDVNRIELWHSRLGVRHIDPDGDITIDERDDPQRAIRAVWARDDAGARPVSDINSHPFRTSLNGRDRSVLVTESADTSIAKPQPVDAKRLYLSSQGAWLDLHGAWDTDLYGALPGKIESWDHIAPMGRDQFVKVVYPGYLYPFGHKASFIKVTERRIDPDVVPPVAYLYQHFFILVKEPIRYYDSLDMPFGKVELRPVVTPFLDDPNDLANPNAIKNQDLFWPTLDGVKFEFTLDCLDQEKRRVVLQAPLMFVSASFGSTKAERNLVRDSYVKPDTGKPAPREIPGLSRSIALAKSRKPGDTAFETHALRFTGEPGTPTAPTSTPKLSGANIVVPAMKHLAPAADAVDVHYATPYLNHGFGGVNGTPQVFLELDTMSPIEFGDGSPAASTAKSGGFLQPSLPVRGLSRALGTVGQVDSIVNPPAGKQPFDPMTFLDGVLPKLFGLFSLVDILEAVGLDKAPSFVTETLNEVAQLLADLQSLQQTLENGVTELSTLAVNAATAPQQQAADAAKTALDAVKAAFAPKLAALTGDISALTSSGDVATFTTNATAILTDLAAVLTTLDQQTKTLQLPPVVKAQLQRLVAALAPLMDVAKIAKQIQSIVAFVQGLDPSNLALKCSFTWQPPLKNYPDGPADKALFYVDPQGLVLSIEARASGKDGVGVDVLAQLSDFGLNLFEDSTLITIAIDRLSFRASNGSKPEVDVVMRNMEWLGALSFIQTLETLIPSDGFSDPPYVDVDASGVKAGFDLALPSIGVGVFSLENISLGADVNVPFLGDAVTVGFYFCTREKPFRLTVMCVGGGGFVGIRLSPKGLVLLEMSLEACAQLGIDLGVASGSVSITIGVYLRLEGEKGSLTGYFRIRGEVDVLGGIFSASITLELSLTYQFDTGKLTGRASIQIEVTIFFFSFSVEVSCQRTLAGSNGDPTFAELLGITNGGQDLPDPGAPDGGVPDWTDYCDAFASV